MARSPQHTLPLRIRLDPTGLHCLAYNYAFLFRILFPHRQPRADVLPHAAAHRGKVIPVTIGTPPPPQAQPGETITFSFSGGYLIVNNARICGDNEIVDYIYADELPGFSYQRTVRVRMDNESLAELDCDYDCSVEVTIPVTASQGTRRLRLGPPFGFRELDFDLEISTSKSP